MILCKHWNADLQSTGKRATDSSDTSCRPHSAHRKNRAVVSSVVSFFFPFYTGLFLSFSYALLQFHSVCFYLWVLDKLHTPLARGWLWSYHRRSCDTDNSLLLLKLCKRQTTTKTPKSIETTPLLVAYWCEQEHSCFVRSWQYFISNFFNERTHIRHSPH